MINKLSKEKYFKYDSKELLGVMRFDFYDGRLSNQWNPRELIIEMNNFTEEEGYIAAHRILEKNKVNAIIATDDLLGFGVQRAIEELVYKDISVVGFNNIPLSQYKNPPLASVDINSEKLGRYATKLIIDKLENRENKGYHVIETNLIERESLK